MAWLRSKVGLCMVLALACGGDDDGGSGETGGEGSTTAPTTTATTATTASTGMTAGEGSGSGESSATGSTTATTTVGEGSESAGSSEASSESGGVSCGDAGPCGADEVCVLPCCGGPAPGCIDMPEGGCDPEDDEVPADQCNAPCTTPTCCIDNCVPDPPYCLSEAELMCGGSSCNVDQCFGSLEGDTLFCECA